MRRRWTLAAFAAWQVCLSTTASADEGAADILSPETITLFGDVRAVAAGGETSWTDDGFGKLRYGGNRLTETASLRLKPEFGEAGIVWQPRFGWSLSGTVVAVAQGGDRLDAGLSEAFLTYKPLTDGGIRVSARAGLMWPPVSLEHGGPEWAVGETITPSAINSWIGEEVKVIGVELNGEGEFGGHTVTATAAGFDYNDTAGALIAFRGWALHDRKALAFRKQPVAPLNEFMEYAQPRYSHPIMDLDPGTLSRPGFYLKLAWDLPVPVHLEVLHSDNNGNPEAVNADLEWGWRTTFDNVGIVAEFAGGWQARAQALTGHTRMGFKIGGTDWIDTRFRSAYGMVTRNFRRGAISARFDVFGTRNRGSAVTAEDDEDGWAATIAARRNLGMGITALVEFLHVESSRDARTRVALAPNQSQSQIQMALRKHW